MTTCDENKINFGQLEPPEYVECELCETGYLKAAIVGGMIGACLIGLVIMVAWVVL